MFHQILTPVGGALLPSFLVAAIPIAIVLLMLGVLRRPAWQASAVGLVAGLIIAVGVWQLPLGLAFNAVALGVVFASLAIPLGLDARWTAAAWAVEGAGIYFPSKG